MTEDYKVEIRGGAWTVTYTEPAGALKFSFEMGSSKDYLYFPNPDAWQRQAPDWAKNRRAEILERISAAFGESGCEAVEIESFEY